MNRLIAVLLVFMLPISAGANTFFEKADCEKVLSPQYSIFPLHRKLFEVRKKLGKELKLTDFSILQDNRLGYVGINMQFPGKRMLLYFDYQNKPAVLKVDVDNQFAKLVGDDVSYFHIQDPEASLEKQDDNEKLMALALSLIIPAAFPYEQNVEIEMKGTNKTVSLSLPVSAFHAVGRLGYSVMLDEPKVATTREISFDRHNEVSKYEYHFNLRLGFRREF